MDQELITIPPQTALQVFTTEGAIDPHLQRVRDEVAKFTADVSTPKGRAEIKAFAFKITKVKTGLESLGKALAAEQKQIPAKIDASRRSIWSTLEALHDQVRKPLTDWEAAETDRVNAHKVSMASIEGAPALCTTADEIRATIAEVEAFVIGPVCEEFEAQYGRIKDEALRTLRTKLGERETLEAEQAELARRRAEAEAQAVHEREERIRAEAAEAERTRAAREAEVERQRVEREAAIERARVESEAKAIREAAQRREDELQRVAADERRRAEAAEHQAAETERRLRMEAEAKAHREAQEAAAREANTRRRARVNRDAMAAFVGGGIDEATARSVVEMIARKTIPHVSISY